MRPDLTPLDRPEVLSILFPIAYYPFLRPATGRLPLPRRLIEADDGVILGAAFWVAEQEAPSILYFHGNGETVLDYHWLAPRYTQRGINLFVADYRGYGESGGTPTVSNTLNDAHSVFRAFLGILEDEGFLQRIFIMGRSLGSLSALEIAPVHQEDIRGLILESGSAHNFRHRWPDLASARQPTLLDDQSPFLNRVKIARVHRPTLIIHGERDEIIPLSEGEELFRSAAAADKQLLVIPKAGHNDVMAVDEELYFGTIERFIRTHS